MSDPLWINDFNVLLKRDRLMEFFPAKDQTNEERVNAIVRLSLYVSIGLAVYHSNAKFFAIFLFFLIFTFIIYRHHPDMKPKSEKAPSIQEKVQAEVEEKAKAEQFNPKLNNFVPLLGLRGKQENLEEETRPDDTDGKCTKPTIDNPFMNVTMKDYMNFDENGSVVNRPPACDPNDPEIKKMMDNTFSNNLYRDVSDVFGKQSSQRNYFTMPWTTIPNKQDEFARWLYLSPKTCKEDQDYCLRYEDIRSKRFVMPNPERNPVSSKKETEKENSPNAI
jgi:hypothetical protein